MATATAPVAPAPDSTIPVPLAIMEERYRGLMYATVQATWDESVTLPGMSKLYYRLDKALRRMVYDLCQHDVAPMDEIVEHLHGVIRQEAIRVVMAQGRPEWAGAHPTLQERDRHEHLDPANDDCPCFDDGRIIGRIEAKE